MCQFFGPPRTGFVYLNRTEIAQGVSVEQLKSTIRAYVGDVYASNGHDLYAVLLYQYFGHVQQDWTSSHAGRDGAAVRGMLMRLLADAHQVRFRAVYRLLSLTFPGRHAPDMWVTRCGCGRPKLSDVGQPLRPTQPSFSGL